MRRLTTWTVCLAIGCIVGSAQATLITFDDLPATVTTEVSAPTSSGFAAVRTGALLSLEFVVDGVTVTISRQNNTPFDIVDNFSLTSQQGKGPSFGSRSLDPFFNTSTNAFIFSFSVPIKVFSILAGDFGGDDTDTMILTSHNSTDGTGPWVDVVQEQLLVGNPDTWSQHRFDIANEDGFSSVKFHSNGAIPNGGGATGMSVFLDRLYFDRGSTVPPPDNELNDPENTGDPTIVVPEPATLVLFGIGGATMIYGRRKRGKKA